MNYCVQRADHVISGAEEKCGNCRELTWAPTWPAAKITALYVNPDENTGGLVMSFRFSFLQRLAILFGQRLFVWFFTGYERPQWPVLFLSDPAIASDGTVLPVPLRAWVNHCISDHRRGYVVPNPLPDGRVSHRTEPSLEQQLRRTIPEKLDEIR
jgi:hypothetical protein